MNHITANQPVKTDSPPCLRCGVAVPAEYHLEGHCPQCVDAILMAAMYRDSPLPTDYQRKRYAEERAHGDTLHYHRENRDTPVRGRTYNFGGC